MNDERLIVFLKYFEDWKVSIDQRPGNLTKADWGNMFLSWQTYEGINITVHSVIDLVKYFLNMGV